ncbi:PREDICTED: FHA domain-containing protein PS1-like [Lupinus angustifolius]|uniref:FHA domain-containing protein PS1-like n=1 Tax=Lupinus angustifolius TaxID=3871 RepID=UPI00092EBA2D|nr:PREDICTED: FHA domain-containing protein PS1-like [Lupinus angustifolius]
MASIVASEEEEGKIPVFTVLKNNAILKNIFILNKPPQPNDSSSVVKDHEDILIVGRHPDCDIMLTHPSISRFHLHIRSKPSSQFLSLIDLSSVHGTWVSGRKVEPGVSVEMKEGDTLRIGASSRVYRLHWIPISRAYDLENPFVSELDVILEPQNEEELVQNLNCCLDEMEEIQSEDSILECVKLLFFDENLEVTVEKEDGAFEVLMEPCGTETSHSPMTSDWENKLYDSLNQELTVKKEIPSAPPLPEGIIHFCCEEEMKIQSKDEMLGVPSDPFGTENEMCDSLNQVLPLPYVESFAECEGIISFYSGEEMKSLSNLSEDEMLGVPSDTFGTEIDLCDSLNQVLPLPYVESFAEYDSTLTLPVVEAVQGTKTQQFHTPPDTFTSPLPPDQEDLFEKRYSSLPINTDLASFGKESAAEAVIPEESGFGCTDREDEWSRDIITATEGTSNSENLVLPVEEVVHDTICQQIKVVDEIVDSICDGQKSESELNAKYCSPDEIVHDIGNKCTGSICPIPLQIESVNLSPQEAVLGITIENPIPQPDTEFLESHGEPIEKKSSIGNIWLRRIKAASAPQIRTSKSTFKSMVEADTEVAMSNVKDTKKKTISKDLFSVLDGQEEEEEVFTPDKENFSPNTLQLRFLKRKGKLEEIKHSKSKWSHNSKDTFCPDIYPNENISPYPNKENRNENKTISKDLFSVSDGEEDIFTPDKENFTPDTLRLRLLKKKGELDETKCSEWSQNSKDNFSPNIYPDERISSTSNKENQTLKVVQEQKLKAKPSGSLIKMVQNRDIMASKNKVERVPFQPLSTGGKSKSRTSCPVSATKSTDVSDREQILDKRINFSDIGGVQKKSWDMVVDTASLMNKESRKALQLLQGLKGTRLIIPRLVIGELHRMKQQFSIFKRISEASLALEWIEECMVNTNWWIHIRSSMEEEGMIAPTPPAFPQSQFSSLEVASPTVEDHILDFTLLYRRKKFDRQLVLLSEDVTLKIKCMAEGLLCEPVQEFHASLVNPFSERFLWTTSSPRGQTWTCQDDVVLREKYCHLHKNKSLKGVASGLKLILLHNSQYKH